jgi:hypothetical protein
MLMGKPSLRTNTACSTGRTVKSAAPSCWGQKAQISSANRTPQAPPKQTVKVAATNRHSVRDGKITIRQFAETQ